MRWRKRTPRDASLTDQWFAWYPVHVGHNQYAWLERVWRRREFAHGRCYYVAHWYINEDDK